MGLNLDRAASAANAVGAGAPEAEIEITSEMIEAGVKIFYEKMLTHEDFCLSPREDDIRDAISAIFCSMAANSPLLRKKSI